MAEPVIGRLFARFNLIRFDVRSIGELVDRLGHQRACSALRIVRSVQISSEVGMHRACRRWSDCGVHFV